MSEIKIAFMNNEGKITDIKDSEVLMELEASKLLQLPMVPPGMTQKEVELIWEPKE